MKLLPSQSPNHQGRAFEPQHNASDRHNCCRLASFTEHTPGFCCRMLLQQQRLGAAAGGVLQLQPRSSRLIRSSSSSLVARSSSSSSSSSNGGNGNCPTDDTSRRRLRFGDRPSHRGRRSQVQQPPSPDLLQQLQALERPCDAAGVVAARWGALASKADSWVGQTLYHYFNWRSSSASKDVLVVMGVFSALVLAAGTLRRCAVDDAGDRAAGGLWADVYQVCAYVFGQDFPGPEASLGHQVLAVGVAVIGLAAFAMVLALVEQVVLDALEANVKRGSKVYESGHILVLGWCVSQRDVEVVRKVVQQICVAHAPEGGTTIVVLTQRSKLEMEGMFWRCLPEPARHGTKLVFRQGSPLVPSDLKLVGASRAAATAIISDQSRCAAEADAQALRCAILLDELDIVTTTASTSKADAPHAYLTALTAAATSDEGELPSLDLLLLGRHVVVELKTANALPLLKYACSSRVIALPTNQLNAQRLAKMVKRPVISIVSQQLFNFENGVSIYVHFFPHLVGSRFGDLAFLFPDGIVLGLVDRATGKARMAPNRDCIVQAAHALIICRPTGISSRAYAPVAAATSEQALQLREALECCVVWSGARGQAISGDAQLVAEPVRAGLAVTQGVAAAAVASSSSSSVASGFVGAGSHEYAGLWSSAVSQVELLRQQAVALSSVADAGQNSSGDEASSSSNVLPGLQQQRAEGSSADADDKQSVRVPVATMAVAAEAAAGADTQDLQGVGRAATATMSPPASSSSQGAALQTADWPVLAGLTHSHAHASVWRQLMQGSQQNAALSKGHSSTCAARGVNGSAAATAAAGGAAGQHSWSHAWGGSRLNDAAVLVPPEYVQVDERAENVVVLGWGPNSLMVDLLRELDHGLSALPSGSEVVFCNLHSPHDSLGAALQLVSLDSIKVRHVTANPLQRSSLGGALDVSAFRCALVLCDELWVDPDADDSNGLESVDEPSVLRLDALVMVAQLNMRKLLEDSALPAINIICQKVASLGLTRFEDRHRLPLGISVNLNSFSAKMLAQIAANPLMLAPVTRLDEDASLTIVDSSALAAVGEWATFWQLIARCQVVGDVLLGYYEIPEHLDEPLNPVVDPIGAEVRSTPRVWNGGDGILKFIVLRHKSHNHGSTSGSNDDLELENTKQAGWVAARERSPGNSTPQPPQQLE